MRVSSIALSGMQAESRRLEVSANNVANVSTDGFRPSTVRQTDERTGGTKASVEKPDDSSFLPADGAGTDLVQEAITQISAVAAYKANAAVAKTAADTDAR